MALDKFLPIKRRRGGDPYLERARAEAEVEGRIRALVKTARPKEPPRIKLPEPSVKRIIALCSPSNREWCGRVAEDALKYFRAEDVIAVMKEHADRGGMPEVALAYLARGPDKGLELDLEPLKAGEFAEADANNLYPGLRLGEPPPAVLRILERLRRP